MRGNATEPGMFAGTAPGILVGLLAFDRRRSVTAGASTRLRLRTVADLQATASSDRSER
jgi:hypothetical protein